jgi:hypothetical protein
MTNASGSLGTMVQLSFPLRFMLVALAGWVNQQHRFPVTVQGGVVLFVLILYALVDDARAKEVVANGRALARLT